MPRGACAAGHEKSRLDGRLGSWPARSGLPYLQDTRDVIPDDLPANLGNELGPRRVVLVDLEEHPAHITASSDKLATHEGDELPFVLLHPRRIFPKFPVSGDVGRIRIVLQQLSHPALKKSLNFVLVRRAGFEPA